MAEANRRIRTNTSRKINLIYPDFRFENKLWKKGFNVVAGCDEVGRGCFAGPVVAAACAFSPKTISFLKGASLEGVKINDSKKLTALQRERADKWIKENCVSWGVGLGSVAEINRTGIVKATNSAFRRAIKIVNENLETRIEYLLIDAFYIPYVRDLKVCLKNAKNGKVNPKIPKNTSRQLAVIKGDEKSFSIAAASIIAKVYRDNLMARLSQKINLYGWETNKGYGTKAHTEAIEKYGLTKHHRKRFVETYFNNSSSFPIQSGT